MSFFEYRYSVSSGKQVIHPNQIDIVNEAFSPSPEKIEWAKELVAAFEQQSNEGIVSLVFERTYLFTILSFNT